MSAPALEHSSVERVDPEDLPLQWLRRMPFPFPDYEYLVLPERARVVILERIRHISLPQGKEGIEDEDDDMPELLDSDGE